MSCLWHLIIAVISRPLCMTSQTNACPRSFIHVRMNHKFHLRIKTNRYFFHDDHHYLRCVIQSSLSTRTSWKPVFQNTTKTVKKSIQVNHSVDGIHRDSSRSPVEKYSDLESFAVSRNVPSPREMCTSPTHMPRKRKKEESYRSRDHNIYYSPLQMRSQSAGSIDPITWIDGCIDRLITGIN